MLKRALFVNLVISAFLLAVGCGKEGANNESEEEPLIAELGNLLAADMLGNQFGLDQDIKDEDWQKAMECKKTFKGCRKTCHEKHDVDQVKKPIKACVQGFKDCTKEKDVCKQEALDCVKKAIDSFEPIGKCLKECNTAMKDCIGIPEKPDQGKPEQPEQPKPPVDIDSIKACHQANKTCFEGCEKDHIDLGKCKTDFDACREANKGKVENECGKAYQECIKAALPAKDELTKPAECIQGCADAFKKCLTDKLP